MGKLIKFSKKKNKSKNKKIKKSINIGEIILAIGAFIAIPWTIMQIYDWINDHKNPSVYMQSDISASYLDSIEDFSNGLDNNKPLKDSLPNKENASSNVKYGEVHMIFDENSDPDKEYLFSENCATQLMITNHYNNQIVMDKIIFKATEIAVAYSLVLTFSPGVATEDGLSVQITNTGWGNAKI